MTGQSRSGELEEALIELQQYLSDSLPPLVVAQSVHLLTKHPPEVVMPTIRAWTAAQYRGAAGSSVPISDYLFHILKKIHMMGEFRLIPREPLAQYLEQLKPVVLPLCPEEDRATLLKNLSHLGESDTPISPVQTIFRQGGPTAAAARTAAGAVAGPGEAAGGLRRFSMFLERLEAQGGLGTTARSPAQAATAASEALAFAAQSSRSGRELEAYLARLKEKGLEAGTDKLFRALAESLPGWVVPVAAGVTALPEGRGLDAMRRIITEAEDPAETGRRFQEMVRAGIDRFNEGSLAQAVSMLELAERLTTEKKVDPGSVEFARRRLGEALNGEQLKKFAEKPDQHGLLRKVLQFFTEYTASGLLEELPREPKRDRRRLILGLLEAHGPPARAAAFEALQRTPATAVGEEEWFFRRNLVYLLRRIPRSAEASFEEESDVVLRHAQLGLPLILIKESITTLGQYRDEQAEKGLAQLLGEIEAMLARPEEAPYEAKDLRALLDRVASTLAKFPTPRARRALVEHARKKPPQLGDTVARLSELGGQDMSEDTETVEQLLALLKSNLPFKLLGVTLRQNDQNLARIVEALSSTRTPAVRRALQEIAERLRGQEAGKAASRTLAAFDRPRAETPEVSAPAASIQGDLEVFGLPALLQSLAESSASGLLTLRGPKGGEAFGTLVMREGKLTDIQQGRLRGEEAFYQLFERPLPGQFAFVKGSTPEKPGAPAHEVLPLILEAMRRYDEFQEAAALVPDGALLEKTGVNPTPFPGEKDGSFLQALWERASQGGTAPDCEESVASDSYRVRRALAHWVEQGALRVGDVRL